MCIRDSLCNGVNLILINVAERIFSIAPVSYTHLDVYKRQAYRETNIKQSNPQTTRNPKSLSRNNTLYHWISDGAKQHTYGYGDSKNR